MKKILLFVVALSSLLIAKSELETCVKCHPAIVEECRMKGIKVIVAKVSKA